jgi:hypothetical protein
MCERVTDNSINKKILHLPTVSRRVSDNTAANPLATQRMIATDVVLKFDTTMYGAIKAPNLEQETQIACPNVLTSVGSSSGVATQVAF